MDSWPSRTATNPAAITAARGAAIMRSAHSVRCSEDVMPLTVLAHCSRLRRKAIENTRAIPSSQHPALVSPAIESQPRIILLTRAARGTDSIKPASTASQIKNPNGIPSFRPGLSRMPFAGLPWVLRPKTIPSPHARLGAWGEGTWAEGLPRAALTNNLAN